MTYMQRKEEAFLSLAVLGEEGMAEHYYPDEDVSIKVGEQVSWTIYVNNRIGEAQYVAVKVKLLNYSILSPNSTLCIHCTAPVVYEFRRVLLDNETWHFPFNWSIRNVEWVGDNLSIKSFSLNGDLINTNIVALHGYNYRFVLELWTFDEKIGDFKFGWRYDDEDFYCAWNQVWFNVTTI